MMSRSLSLGIAPYSLCRSLVLTSVVAASFFGATPSPASAAELKVETSPPGAAVSLDDRYVGPSPVTVTEVAPGPHVVRAERRGRVVATKRVEVGEPSTTLTLKLSRLGEAHLIVQTSPADAHVYVNGEFRGTTPLRLSGLTPNQYQVRVEKVNFTPVSEQIELKDGDEKTLEWALESRSVDFYLTQIDNDPERVVNYTELCHLYMLEGRFEDAFEMLAGGLNAAGTPGADSEEIRRLYAEVEKIWEGQYEFADDEQLLTIRSQLKASLEASILQSPDNPRTYEAMGEILQQEKDAAAAIEFFEQAYRHATQPMVRRQLEREVARLLLTQARAHEKEKDYEAAVKAYREIVDKFPGSSSSKSALTYLAVLYGQRLKDDAKAVEMKLEVVRQFPTSDRCSGILSEVARLYRQEKEYDKAVDLYRQVIRDYPHYDGRAEAQWAIATIYMSYLKDTDQGLTELRRFVSEYPENDRCATAYYQMIRAYRQLGKEKEAEWARGKLIHDYPLSQYAYYERRADMDPEYLRRLGQDWAQCGKVVKEKEYEAAIEAYREFQKNYADTYYAVEAQNQIIRLCRSYLKDPDREREEQRRYMELYPWDDSCRTLQYRLAYSYYSKKDWENAIREYNEFVRRFPDDDRCPQFLSTIGTVYYYYLKDREAAARTYQRLAREYPKSDYVPRAYRIQGDCYVALDKLREAKQAYQYVIEHFPDSEEAYHAWRSLRRLP